MTYFIKVLYQHRGSSEQQFKNKVYELSDKVLYQLNFSRYSLSFIESESEFVKELFKDKYTKYRPTKTYETKTMKDKCTKTNKQLSDSLESMYNVIDDIVTYFDNASSTHNSGGPGGVGGPVGGAGGPGGGPTSTTTTSTTTSNYVIGSIDVMHIVNTLQSESIPLGENTTQFITCLTSYKMFLDEVVSFMATNKFSTGADTIFQPVIDYTDEVKKEKLIKTQVKLNSIEEQIRAYTKTKLEVAKDINSTIVSQIEKQLESLRTTINTEILDKIISSVDAIKREANDAYRRSLNHLVRLEGYFGTTRSQYTATSSKFETSAKNLQILRGVSCFFFFTNCTGVFPNMNLLPIDNL